MAENKQPDIAYTRDEVTAALPKWLTIRDCLAGQDAIKANDLKTVSSQTGDRYLPKPNATDRSAENAERYRQYIERACWYNVTGRTHRGMVGQTFQKEPVVEVPVGLEALLDDVDGGGVPLLSQAEKADGHLLAYGRAGLLVDYPSVPEGVSTVAEMETGNLRPTIVLYEPWQIINWRTVRRGAKNVVSLVVLQEEHADDVDGFEVETGDQWRVLRLDEGGYVVDVYRDDDKGTKVLVETSMPQGRSGGRLQEIPFVFIGAENNDTVIDPPPLGDLADLNIAHYRNSADYEEACFLVGQPTPWAAGLTQEWVDTNFKGGVAIGSRATIPLPVGGACGLLQALPNTMPKEAMEAKERQMVAIGARLVEQRQVQRTATEARQEQASETSVLGMCGRNVAAGYVRALEWAAIFAGAPGKPKMEIDADAALREMSPEQLRELTATWQGKGIATSEYREKLRRAGIATLDDEEYKEEIESEPSYGLPAAAGAIDRAANDNAGDEDEEVEEAPTA